MDWHARYTQQAYWTRNLRKYLFEKSGLLFASRILEVGCGTGAILAELNTTATLHGLDIQPAPLTQAKIHAPKALLTCGDALSLPYPDHSFYITYCHYLLLWVRDPLYAIREMKRVTRPGGHILALAEPDYSAREDQPEELATLGKLQTDSLQYQGANPSLGGRVADLFFKAGIQIVETGAIQRSYEVALTADERELEWTVLESDLAEIVPIDTIQTLKRIDEEAWKRGERVLHVPTYFVWGRKDV